MGLVSELKRRDVFRMAALYVVAAWLIMQVAEVVIGLASLPGWIGKAILASLVVGFPIALVLSWIYELTPKGIILEKGGDSGRLTSKVAGRHVDFIVIALLCAGLVLFAYDKWWVESPSDKSIAVLPFENMSGDPAQEYFSDGISTEILALLSNRSQLSVTPRTSSFAFKDKGIGTRSLAEALNVTYILDGAVRVDGNRVRITVELIHAPSETLVWAQPFERLMADVIPTQYEIADSVVTRIQGELSALAPIPPTIEPEAYDLYLRAKYVLKEWTGDALDKAAILYDEAVTIDPKFVTAWVRLADVESYRWAFGRGSASQSLNKSQYSLEEALRLDPRNAEALALLGMINIGHDRDFDTGARHLSKAQELDPRNPYVIEKAGLLLWFLGRLEESTEVYEYLTSVDPANSQLLVDLGSNHLCTGRLEDAIAAFKTALYLSPDNMEAQSQIVRTWILMGRPDAATEFLENGRGGVGAPLRAILSFASGDVDASDSFLNESIDKHGDSRPWYIAQVFAFRGETDRAFEWLRRAAVREDPALLLAVSEPIFRSLHNDPRWKVFLDEIGLSPRQLNEVSFRAFVPEARKSAIGSEPPPMPFDIG